MLHKNRNDIIKRERDLKGVELMATLSFTRKIIVTGKKATDMIVDALTCDTIKTDTQDRKKFLEENRKREEESLKKFVSLYKK